MSDPRPWTRLLLPLALVVGVAWRHALGLWFTDTDTLVDVVVARVDTPADLWRQLRMPLTGGYGGTNANFYRPLAMLHFALQRALFGWRPAGWHAWDLGLHLLALAVFARVGRALGARRVEAALFVLIAGLHPVCAEIVPAIALLLALLVGLALLAAGRGRPLLAGLASALALTAKEPAIAAFPAVLSLVLVTGGRRAAAWLLGPWPLLVPAFLVVRGGVLHGMGGYVPGDVVQLWGACTSLAPRGSTPWRHPGRCPSKPWSAAPTSPCTERAGSPCSCSPGCSPSAGVASVRSPPWRPRCGSPPSCCSGSPRRTPGASSTCRPSRSGCCSPGC